MAGAYVGTFEHSSRFEAHLKFDRLRAGAVAADAGRRVVATNALASVNIGQLLGQTALVSLPALIPLGAWHTAQKIELFRLRLRDGRLASDMRRLMKIADLVGRLI